METKRRQARSRSRIITFYSYKGGTGRSMAIANIAWILASDGNRVLVIDWDLEAPGLHRYFHPFLDDPELSDSPGLIDFLVDFTEGARVEHSRVSANRRARKAPDKWFKKYTNLLPYAYSLNWEFPEGGTLDFVPAGRQGCGYGVRVTTFDWQAFYTQLGGGVFLETVKKQLREEYAYILIDSRTGISDISGICTVQMPDELVVCFTLNHQSIAGAAAVAQSAFAQRQKPGGEPGLRIWPVPTRVELAEKEKLDAARGIAQRTFQQYLGHLTRAARQSYWAGIEVPYDPYFAYEEVLATVAERRRSKLSVLDSMLALTRYLSDGKVTELPRLPEAERLRILGLFARESPVTTSSGAYFFLSHATEDRSLAHQLADYLNAVLGKGTVVWDEMVLRPGDLWSEVLDNTARQATGVIVLITPTWLARMADSLSAREIAAALARGQRVIPMLVDVSWSDFHQLPAPLAPLKEIHGLRMTLSESGPGTSLAPLVNVLVDDLSKHRQEVEDDPDDPQKGRWGGSDTSNGRTLHASVREAGADWFKIRLAVKGSSQRPLRGEVEFHLHPTFQPAVQTVPVKNGRAELVLHAWGAFTVGATADGGQTRLELDLAQLADAPALFRQR